MSTDNELKRADALDRAAGIVGAATGPEPLFDDDESRARFAAHVLNRLSSDEGSDSPVEAELQDLYFGLRDHVADVAACASVAVQRLGDLALEEAVYFEDQLQQTIRAAAALFISFEDALAALVVHGVVSGPVDEPERGGA